MKKILLSILLFTSMSLAAQVTIIAPEQEHPLTLIRVKPIRPDVPKSEWSHLVISNETGITYTYSGDTIQNSYNIVQFSDTIHCPKLTHGKTHYVFIEHQGVLPGAFIGVSHEFCDAIVVNIAASCSEPDWMVVRITNIGTRPSPKWADQLNFTIINKNQTK
jgi:hypothetical protein